MSRTPGSPRLPIRALQLRRRWLESKLLQPQAMISASLIERYLSAGGSRRASPAYYLSRSQQGRSKLTYVKKQEVAAVRQQCEAYHLFQQNLREWRRLTRELEGLWRRLQASQSA